jgi:ABC-type Fe3+ transport system substrate-binding protein
MGKRKDPLSCDVSNYAYKRNTSVAIKTECNLGWQDLLNNIEYLKSRGLPLLLSSSELKNVQDKYQLPTEFDSKEKYAKAVAFAVVCDYWPSILTPWKQSFSYRSCILHSLN